MYFVSDLCRALYGESRDGPRELRSEDLEEIRRCQEERSNMERLRKM